jgi:mono/diheme cytochrome c family protein
MKNYFLPAALVAASAWLGGCSSVSKTAYPPLHADNSPAAIKRGEGIFRGDCEACHRQGGSQQASGGKLSELPEMLGTFYAANITSHPTAGIGKATDEELARIIRYGVNREGKLSIMPPSAMGDADIQAVLGFLRSADPLFAPDPTVQPPQEPSFVGKIGIKLALDVPDRPAQGIPVPAKGVTPEYGRYMAHDVHDCAGCHSPGRDGTGKKAFSGGNEFRTLDGSTVQSSNITFDATGLEGWTLEDFTRALRDGLGRDGAPVRHPMPRYRGPDDTDMRALYEYLRSVKPVKHEIPGGHKPAPAAQVAQPGKTLASK